MLNKGHYIIRYIRPSDLKEHSSIEIISSNPNDVLEFQLPDFQNDLLILATRISNDIP